MTGCKTRMGVAKGPWIQLWTAGTRPRFGFTVKWESTVKKPSRWFSNSAAKATSCRRTPYSFRRGPVRWLMFCAHEIDSYIAFSSAQKLRCVRCRVSKRKRRATPSGYPRVRSHFVIVAHSTIAQKSSAPIQQKDQK